MATVFLRLLATAVLFCASVASATVPGTISYQGTLGSADGVAVDAQLNITFRLYFGQEDATSYWDETQLVDVSDGKFSVELGKQTPMPNELFGAPLYLGIQVQGDVEMTPRLALSAAPYAFRARSLMRGTIHVPADGLPADNGAALRAAVSSAANATADNRYVISVDAGEFDLGAESLLVPSHVELVGAGPDATSIRAALVGPAVLLHSHTALTSLGVVNHGSDGTLADPNVAIGIADASTDVTVRTVSAASMPPAGVQDTAVHTAIRYERVSRLLLTDLDINAERGQYVYGIRAALPQDGARETDIVFRNVRITASAAPFLRGIDLSSRMDVTVRDMSVKLSSGGIVPVDVTAFRGQIDVAMDVDGLTVDLDLADTSPETLRAVSAYLLSRFDLRNFTIRVAAGSCSAAGFHIGLLVWNVPAEETLALQAQPRISDGRIVMASNDCGMHGLANDGSALIVDNVQVDVTHTGLNGWAFGYAKRASGWMCNDAFVLPGAEVLRNSSIRASSESAGANAVDMCAGTLSIENSTLFGDNAAFNGTDNELVDYAFAISHSRLGSTRGAALLTGGEVSGTVMHTHIDSPVSPVAAHTDPLTGLRSTMACIATSTPSGFSAGPTCECTVAPDCPAATP